MHPLRAVRFLALTLLLAATACDWFDEPTFDEARVVVEGDVSVPVRIITSKRFVAAINEVGGTQVEVFLADTFDVAAPFDRTFDIRDQQQFFSQVSPRGQEGRVRVRVFIDGRERFNDTGALDEADPFRFVFVFNRFVGTNIEVL